ncbi:Hypothetical Protein RSKD131_3132 [Cereibacter sphaeroides KD131]|nr:Hypothetical Protein RSKD131_3132 [Cereibacter sphaeroides KD131]
MLPLRGTGIACRLIGWPITRAINRLIKPFLMTLAATASARCNPR